MQEGRHRWLKHLYLATPSFKIAQKWLVVVFVEAYTENSTPLLKNIIRPKNIVQNHLCCNTIRCAECGQYFNKSEDSSNHFLWNWSVGYVKMTVTPLKRWPHLFTLPPFRVSETCNRWLINLSDVDQHFNENGLKLYIQVGYHELITWEQLAFKEIKQNEVSQNEWNIPETYSYSVLFWLCSEGTISGKWALNWRWRYTTQCLRQNLELIRKKSL